MELVCSARANQVSVTCQKVFFVSLSGRGIGEVSNRLGPEADNAQLLLHMAHVCREQQTHACEASSASLGVRAWRRVRGREDGHSEEVAQDSTCFLCLCVGFEIPYMSHMLTTDSCRLILGASVDS